MLFAFENGRLFEIVNISGMGRYVFGTGAILN